MIIRARAGARTRDGAALVETAVILPILFVLLLGIVVGSSAVFAYQQTSFLAREGARYAAVRGERYESSTGSPPITAADVYENAIRPKMVSLDPAKLTYGVTWPQGRRPGNPVVVTLEYRWDLGILFPDSTFRSTSTFEINW